MTGITSINTSKTFTAVHMAKTVTVRESFQSLTVIKQKTFSELVTKFLNLFNFRAFLI